MILTLVEVRYPGDKSTHQWALQLGGLKDWTFCFDMKNGKCLITSKNWDIWGESITMMAYKKRVP